MRVLIVEDNDRLGQLLLKGLRENAYAVDLVTNGEDALFRMDVDDHDLVILDVMLPGIDGVNVCREIRNRGSRVPVLLLTAMDAVEDKIRGLDAGADDYLTKPFQFGELLARVRALLRRFENIAPEKVMIGEVTVDLGQRRATRRESLLDLTAREFALLEYFVRNRGRVVTRAEISEHVWDDKFNAFSNTIEVIINRLRKKLAADEGGPVITTKRGQGYVLE